MFDEVVAKLLYDYLGYKFFLKNPSLFENLKAPDFSSKTH